MSKVIPKKVLSFFKEEYIRLDISDPIEIKGEIDLDELPKTAGAYIMYVKGESFIYRVGKSPVFYIGMSKNLSRRIRTHIKYTKEANQTMHKRNSYLYWPRYEYAAQHEAYLIYIKTWQGKTPKALEDDLLAYFARKHFAFPVANGVGAWKKIYKLFGEKYDKGVIK